MPQRAPSSRDDESAPLWTTAAAPIDAPVTAARAVPWVDSVDLAQEAVEEDAPRDDAAAFPPVSPTFLTPRQRRLFLVPPALYLLLLPYTLGYLDSWEPTNLPLPGLLYTIIPLVLALYLGAKGKSYRFGALAGILTGLVTELSTALNEVVHHRFYFPNEFLVLIILYLIMGLVLGVSGAIAGSILRGLRGLRKPTRR